MLNSLHCVSTGINWNTVITLDLKTMLPLCLVGWWWWDSGKGSRVAQTDLTLFCKVKADLEFLNSLTSISLVTEFSFNFF